MEDLDVAGQIRCLNFLSSPNDPRTPTVALFAGHCALAALSLELQLLSSNFLYSESTLQLDNYRQNDLNNIVLEIF